MKKVNLADFGDLLTHAVTMGYFWNQAHEFLVKDEVVPMYESKTRDHYMSEVLNNDYGWSEDSLKVVKSFMEAHNITEFTLTQ